MGKRKRGCNNGSGDVKRRREAQQRGEGLQWVRPVDVHFGQRSLSHIHSDCGRTVYGNIQAIQAASGRSIEFDSGRYTLGGRSFFSCIRVSRDEDGNLWTRDHRRLFIMQCVAPFSLAPVFLLPWDEEVMCKRNGRSVSDGRRIKVENRCCHPAKTLEVWTNPKLMFENVNVLQRLMDELVRLNNRPSQVVVPARAFSDIPGLLFNFLQQGKRIGMQLPGDGAIFGGEDFDDTPADYFPCFRIKDLHRLLDHMTPLTSLDAVSPSSSWQESVFQGLVSNVAGRFSIKITLPDRVLLQGIVLSTFGMHGKDPCAVIIRDMHGNCVALDCDEASTSFVLGNGAYAMRVWDFTKCVTITDAFDSSTGLPLFSMVPYRLEDWEQKVTFPTCLSGKTFTISLLFEDDSMGLLALPFIDLYGISGLPCLSPPFMVYESRLTGRYSDCLRARATRRGPCVCTGEELPYICCHKGLAYEPYFDDTTGRLAQSPQLVIGRFVDRISPVLNWKLERREQNEAFVRSIIRERKLWIGDLGGDVTFDYGSMDELTDTPYVGSRGPWNLGEERSPSPLFLMPHWLAMQCGLGEARWSNWK